MQHGLIEFVGRVTLRKISPSRLAQTRKFTRRQLAGGGGGGGGGDICELTKVKKRRLRKRKKAIGSEALEAISPREDLRVSSTANVLYGIVKY